MTEQKRCLVTGGAGFIGSHTVDVLLENGYQVSVIDNLSTGKREQVPKDVQFFEMNILDNLELIFEAARPQYVIHLAAQISVSVSVREPEIDAKNNILGTIHLLEQCRKFGVKRIVYASSGAAYGEPQFLPLTEEHPKLCVSPYGISKYVAEKYLYFYRHQFGVEFAAMRYANVFGPRQDPHGEAGVVAIFNEKLLRGEDAVIFGDGEQTRDFVYVKDVARANVMAIEAQLDPSLYPAFNVSAQKQTTVNTLFELIKKYAGSTQPAIHGPARGGDVYHACLANEKIKTHLGWEPRYAVEEGIRETAEFFRLRMVEQ
ncbi:MAG: NAD-dependent epimerase/dehydratase family protein [Candidatus Omnitrophota bacterium]|jgi:UDP-glucose 4-epimerase|nr:MAG: NAD-dependent epimerase/dehydratase family protein [Candidatus Omnitrophota bacterium]